MLDASVAGSSGSDEQASRHFALRVQGESMREAGILDGDYVIVRAQPTAENGEIVAALLGEEATVKRFFQEAERIRLQPEHPTMEPIVVNKQQPLSVLGKVVAVFRQVA